VGTLHQHCINTAAAAADMLCSPGAAAGATSTKELATPSTQAALSSAPVRWKILQAILEAGDAHPHCKAESGGNGHLEML
jgi:hypothetical protein